MCLSQDAPILRRSGSTCWHHVGAGTCRAARTQRTDEAHLLRARARVGRAARVCIARLDVSWLVRDVEARLHGRDARAIRGQPAAAARRRVTLEAAQRVDERCDILQHGTLPVTHS
jgi:hypothetical protein